MARCGCTGGCACQVTGAGPITVTGNGSPGAPFVITMFENGFTGCQAITACVGQYLGPGLAYDPGTGRIQALVSRDGANGISFGTDGGLYGGAGGGGGATCQKSVAGLPAAPGVAGAESLAGLIGPYNTRAQIEYVVANDVDIAHFTVAATSDGAAWVSDSYTGEISPDRTNLYCGGGLGGCAPVYARYTPSHTVRTVYNYAGSLDDPYPGAAVASRVNSGGWYGFMAANEYLLLASDALRLLDGKAVALLDCQTVGAVTNRETDNVAAALRAVRQYCAQTWSMVGVGVLSNIATVSLAGATPVFMMSQVSTWGTTTTPVTAAQIVSAGGSWVVIHEFYADSVFTAFKNAGLNVLMQGASRQADKTRVTTLGIRGFLGKDPVYTRGPGTYDYRRTRDPWDQRRMGNGQLSHMTDQGVSTGTGARGYFQHSASPSPVSPRGLVIPPGFGNGGGVPTILCGWECALINPTSYTIALDMMMDTLPTGTSGKMGLIFGMTDDGNTFQYNGSDGNPKNMPVNVQNYYRVYQRVNGEIGIQLWNAGVFSTLATLAGPAMAAQVYNFYLLTVTSTTVTWRRSLIDGTQYTVNATNSALRGPYFAIEKEELNPGNSAFQFRGIYDNIVVTGQEGS
jgi:hypothetical protein